jgi:phosphoglycolate phosphatase
MARLLVQKTFASDALSASLLVVAPMVKHVVFDFDGTIADSEEVCFRLLNEIGSELGYREVTRADLQALKQMNYPERLQYLGIPMYRVPFLSIQARRRYRLLQDSLAPFPGIPEALLRLRQAGAKLHVLSSNSVENIQHFLQRHSMDVFETITSERSFFGKHIGLRRFLRSLDLTSSEVVYVADEIRDIDACRKIGLRVVSAGWGFDLVDRLRLANPGMTALTPADAVVLIESLSTEAAVPESVPLLEASAMVATP